MKAKFLALIALNIVAGTASARIHNGVDGGGGMAVVCEQSAGSQTVELLDLYEAKAMPKISVFKASGDLLEDYVRLTNNSLQLQSAGWQLPVEEQKRNIRHMLDLAVWHTESTALPFLNDQGQSRPFRKIAACSSLRFFTTLRCA